MPEGDTLFRTADVLRRVLVGETVTDARARPGGAWLDRIVGDRVEAVRSQGKHLLIAFCGGLTLHTHLGMHGSWHRYGPTERWRRHPDTAVAVLRTERGVAVCFDAPVVELIETRALAIHPVLANLGPDLLATEPDLETATTRLRAPERAGVTVAEALLDQSAAAGIGNVIRSEALFVAGLDPFRRSGSLDAETARRVLRIAADQLRSNTGGGARTTVPFQGASTARPGRASAASRLWVYGRAGRPCRRCGELIRSATIGSRPRRLYWCPGCQGAGGGASMAPARERPGPSGTA